MKRILLFISMFLFIFNVKALTFNVNLTNIEDKGNNGTVGSIERIDIPNKELDVLFEDIGAEVSFDLTATNTGDRAGTLKSITVTSENDKIEYTNNLPEGGLAINGNDSNSVTITAKVKEGATNGKTTSEIKITYNYDEGSCPEGEILSDDESMCLCPEGTERNENGVCVKPEKETIECKADEIYNEAKKICEKKVVPKSVSPSNPKTLDNIVLITLLFVVSGLGIYAVMYKKLQTKNKKITAGVLIGVITLSLSFTVLAGVYGLDNLLGAIVNPVTKSKEIVVTVNEEIDLIETWDGTCSLSTNELTPDNIFEGGSGTESDPYQVKTAEQLSCFATSVNNGTTYEGQYIKQTKNIKLNDNTVDNVNNGNTSSLHEWIRIGYYDTNENHPFAGSYDGDDHSISGLYFNNPGVHYLGLFGNVNAANISNLEVSDASVYSTKDYATILCAKSVGATKIDNVMTYGKVAAGSYTAGLVSTSSGNLVITDSVNNAELSGGYSTSGILSESNNVTMTNVINNGDITSNSSGAAGLVHGGNVELNSCFNTGDIVSIESSQTGGLVAYAGTVVINDSGNEGNITKGENANATGGLVGTGTVTIDNSYNSGNITFSNNNGGSTDVAGLVGYGGNKTIITNSFNTGDITMNGRDTNTYPNYESRTAGILGESAYETTLTNTFNTGDITGLGAVGGIYGSATGGSITNSFNHGEIDGQCNYVGGIGGRSFNMTANKVFNIGSIVGKSSIGSPAGLGGLFGEQVTTLTNSYNIGNIETDNFIKIGGLVGFGKSDGTITNSYNFGDITLNNKTYNDDVWLGGIVSDSSTTSHTYNLGNISVTYPLSVLTSYGDGPNIGGIQGGSGSVENNVNVGSITLNASGTISTDANRSITLGGIVGNSGSSVKNNFNAGEITIDSKYSSSYITPVLKYGEIMGWAYSYDNISGNLYTHNNGTVANGLTRILTDLNDSNYGSYTTNDVPDILTIINGDDAFEYFDGDSNLTPTLKD